ncbi:MAG: hypothetical protein IKL53_07945 [Lachnospiraceae bacterium]|nr:hypothetical protein [Lachnospiraceae bacterium]
MAIYRARTFVSEGAIEAPEKDPTPEYPGVDLDAVEKAIIDQTDDHDCCSIDKSHCESPVEECAAIMYESEYNFNQIMKCIGINELKEFSNGRDLVLEGADLHAFFENVKKLIVKMAEGFMAMCQKAFTAIKNAITADKKLVGEYAKDIEVGFGKDGWKFENAWDLNALNAKYNPLKQSIADVDFEELINDTENNVILDGDTFSHAAAVKRISGVEVSDEGNAAAQMKEALNKKFFVSTTYESGAGNELLNTVMGILKNTSDIDELNTAYADIKKGYKDLLNKLKLFENSARIGKFVGNVADDKDGAKTMGQVQNVLTKYTELAKFEKNIQHNYFIVCLSAHKARRNQARKMALKWYNIGHNTTPEKAALPAPKEEPKHENTMFKFDFGI